MAVIPADLIRNRDQLALLTRKPYLEITDEEVLELQRLGRRLFDAEKVIRALVPLAEKYAATPAATPYDIQEAFESYHHYARDFLG